MAAECNQASACAAMQIFSLRATRSVCEKDGAMQRVISVMTAPNPPVQAALIKPGASRDSCCFISSAVLEGEV